MKPNKKYPVIELTDIKKTYTTSAGVETRALRGVNLTIHEGDFVAIMGASGSGKSSLMSIIGLLDKHFEGTYKLEGKDISELSDGTMSELRSKSIGFIFQQFNLLKRTTVLENVLLPTTYRSRPDDEIRALNAIKQVGLEQYIDNHTNQLSGGQMQRVAIARALMMNPSILLADEPTGNLDHKTAHEIMDLFTTINKQGTTIVLITHEDDIAAYAKQRYELYDGLFKKGSDQ
ncbi:MAG TPA: ABC transporter ATP-binding protein [Candidatus Saccharibacteria bacterium]|jgi:putative ABC transport system ATP-binding protein|nr:ABC transporter ATP-binding protein [Candidatus Saccharibacteria bacterium]HMR38017.1 ABC transporter ATP-binding protein [Candidatus Saccharibacteria bacterium]